MNQGEGRRGKRDAKEKLGAFCISTGKKRELRSESPSGKAEREVCACKPCGCLEQLWGSASVSHCEQGVRGAVGDNREKSR